MTNSCYQTIPTSDVCMPTMLELMTKEQKLEWIDARKMSPQCPSVCSQKTITKPQTVPVHYSSNFHILFL